MPIIAYPERNKKIYEEWQEIKRMKKKYSLQRLVDKYELSKTRLLVIIKAEQKKDLK